MTPAESADLATAYARSAYPRMGLSLDRVLAEPALRGTLELLPRIHTQAARRLQGTRAGRYMETTAQ